MKYIYIHIISYNIYICRIVELDIVWRLHVEALRPGRNTPPTHSRGAFVLKFRWEKTPNIHWIYHCSPQWLLLHTPRKKRPSNYYALPLLCYFSIIHLPLYIISPLLLYTSLLLLPNCYRHMSHLGATSKAPQYVDCLMTWPTCAGTWKWPVRQSATIVGENRRVSLT